MSVYPPQSAHESPLHSAQSADTAAWPEHRQVSAQTSLLARVAGCWRRVRRELTQVDACDMTPERASAYQQAFDRISATDIRQDPAARRRALEACIPLLYNIRIPSIRAHYLRRIACLAISDVNHPEQFMQQMFPVIEFYGRGLSPSQILQLAGM